MIYTHINANLVLPNRQSLIEQLFNCKNFEKSDRLLGFSKGRGITWFLNTQAELGINLVLRHYHRGGLFGKIIKDRYVFQSIEKTRAFQEFSLLEKMHAWHLPVPRPVAIQIQKGVFFYRADIMIEKIENTRDLSQILQNKKLSSAQYIQIGKLIRQLHNHQVHHTDLNIHNILLDTSGQFWLIDFDKCYIDQQNETWKQKNLERLLRSFHKEQGRLNIHFSEPDWENLLKGYHD
nr:3-deoxy-D-manno-octulosonic acid kinase [uncultured Haemophilus sp.]